MNYIYLKNSNEIAGPVTMEVPNKYDDNGLFMFIDHMENLPSYPVSGEHDWEDWQEVVEGKDFEIEDQFWVGSAWWPTKHLVNRQIKPGTKTRTVAIPLQQTKPEQGVNADKIISDYYDTFFGTGYWEVEYKKHIVAFATQCLKLIPNQSK